MSIKIIIGYLSMLNSTGSLFWSLNKKKSRKTIAWNKNLSSGDAAKTANRSLRTLTI